MVKNLDSGMLISVPAYPYGSHYRTHIPSWDTFLDHFKSHLMTLSQYCQFSRSP